MSAGAEDFSLNSVIEKEGEKKNADGNNGEKCEPEEDDGAQTLISKNRLDLGPQFSLKEQLDKDKDDESLRKWKERLLGGVDVSIFGEKREPEVEITGITIMCQGRPDIIILSKPLFSVVSNRNNKTTSASLFTVKEGTKYKLMISFIVSNNIVSGLKYKNSVCKAGVRVDSSKVMMGTFSPRKDAYIFELEEDTMPSGVFVRGSYSARTKVVDDDGKCYLDQRYCFEIQKKWPQDV